MPCVCAYAYMHNRPNPHTPCHTYTCLTNHTNIAWPVQASLRALDAGDALADAPELQRVHSQASVRGLLLRLQDAVRQATYGGRGSSLQSAPKL
jgi:hypothetical protein